VGDAVERLVRFGAADHLVGVVTVPAQPRAGAPACLLMNAGVVHRIGPHRINVKIARALADDGITSMRLDLSGLGDSAPAPGALHSAGQAQVDLGAAMDLVRAEYGIDRFVVFGVCSGAINAYRLALADPRIVGLAMFDGYAYPTFKTHVVRRWRRFRSLPWRTLASKPAQWWRGRHAARPVEEDGDAQLAIPTRQEFRAAMERLHARGVSVWLYYSASFLEAHNYHGQLRDAFRNAPFLDRIRYDYRPDVDHTLTTLAAQRTLIASMREWVQSVAAGSTDSSR